MLRGVQLVYSKMFIFYKQFFPMVLGHSRLYRFFVLGCFLVLLFFQKRYCTITVKANSSLELRLYVARQAMLPFVIFCAVSAAAKSNNDEANEESVN